MNESEFWNLIESAKRESQGDADRQVLLVSNTLERQPARDIVDFDHLLHEQLRKSYTQELWAAAYIINGGCSDDGFDYFRAWLIAQGKEIFEQAVKDPETLVDAAEPDSEMELLLYAASNAFQTQTKTAFPQPKRLPLQLTGDAWEEDETALKAKFPKLFAKFWEGKAEDPKAPAKPVDVAAAIDFLTKVLTQGKAGPGSAESLYLQAVFMVREDNPEKLAEATALLAQAADLGHAGAQYLLGAHYQDGRGVPQSFPKAEKLYRQAAENGHADACGALGSLYQTGLEIDQDPAEAFKWYKKGAELGSAESEFGLGLLYDGGLGVEQNWGEAYKWFQRAAQNGHASAALNTGLYHLNGKGISPDATEAFKWFQLAAEAGSDRARFNLGVLYEKGRGVEQDLAKAVEMYQLAGDQNHGGALVNLGMMYANGLGVAQDFTKAADFYQRAAAAGNQIALSNLGTLYQHGRGVPKNEAEAVRLYRECADAGIAVGQFNLGSMYHRGIGVAKDDVEAVRWYRLAAAQNHPSALNNLGDAYENGYGVAQDYAEAAKWYRQAAQRGVSVSQYSLGKLYRDGLGVKQDFREAGTWFKAALEKGLEKAGPELEALYAAGHVQRPAATTKPSPPPTPPSHTPAKAGSEAAQKIVSPPAAAERVLCLRALLRRSQIELMLIAVRQNPKAVDKLPPAELEAEARQINDWLRDEDLWSKASDQERDWLKLNPGTWPEKMILQTSWRAEALGVIGWALGLADQIAPYDEQLEKVSFAYHLKLPAPSKPFIADAKLRDEKDILQAREIAEAWLWRARTTQLQKEPDKYPPPPGMTFEKIIALAAAYWEKAGAFKAIADDYPARGKAYAQLTEAEWQELRSIATERLYGLNWLCKQSANWDLVPTGT